ncbi:hypothetical protein KKG66_07335, partial [bacterium]|nr:hypothetical protein [bacterium]
MTTRLLMLSIMLTVSCSLAADESFKNFRIPDHYVFASAVSGKGYYDLENAGYKHGDMRDRAIYGNASGKIYWLKDSDVLRSIFSMSAGLSSDRDSYHFDNCEDGSTGEQVRSSNSHDASASWKGWFYPAQIPLGIYTEMNGSISASEYPRTHTGTWTSGNTDYAEIEDNYDKSN